MIDYGCSNVLMGNLMLILWNVFVMSMWLVAYGLYVTYMLILCRLLTPLYVRLNSCRFDYMYQSCRLITRIDHLCSTTCVYAYV